MYASFPNFWNKALTLSLGLNKVAEEQKKVQNVEGFKFGSLVQAEGVLSGAIQLSLRACMQHFETDYPASKSNFNLK